MTAIGLRARGLLEGRDVARGLVQRVAGAVVAFAIARGQVLGISGAVRRGVSRRAPARTEAA